MLSLFCLVSFVQGASFATFSMLPGLSLDLFAALAEEHLPWSLNCNNITQALFIPALVDMQLRITFSIRVLAHYSLFLGRYMSAIGVVNSSDLTAKVNMLVYLYGSCCSLINFGAFSSMFAHYCYNLQSLSSQLNPNA